MRAVASVLLIVAIGACKKSEVIVPNEPTAAASSSSSAASGPEMWRGLHWDMKLPEAMKVLEGAGAKVSERKPMKDPSSWISAKIDYWDATVYFDEKGRMNQITLTASTITKTQAESSKERLTKRFGPVKGTSSNAEYSWGSRRAGSKGSWATLKVVPDPTKGTWNAYEERGTSETNGAAGLFDLTWGAKATDVETKLRAAGFEVKNSGLDDQHCRMPNPSPRCHEEAMVVVRFEKGVESGRAAVHPKEGLRQITHYVTGIASEADARAHTKKLDAHYGAFEEKEESTTTRWSDATAEVRFELRERKTGLTAFESYRPPGSRE